MTTPDREQLHDLLEAVEEWVIALLRAGTGAELVGNVTALRARVRQARENLVTMIERMDR